MRSFASVVILAAAALCVADATRFASNDILSCSSTGDTHVNSFDSDYFDVMGPAIYVMAKDKRGFFEVQVSQQRWVQNWDRITVIKDMAVRCGSDVVAFEISDDGRPMNNKQPKTTIKFNGKAISPKGEEYLRNYKNEKPARGKPGVLRVKYSGNRHSHSLTVTCNREASLDAPGTYEARIYTRVSRNWAYSNVYVRADKSVHNKGDFEGYCGFGSSDFDQKVQSFGCTRNKFQSKDCQALITIPSNKPNLFHHKVDTGETTDTITVLDEARLKKAMESCQTKMDEAVPGEWVKSLPLDFSSKIAGIVSDCAYDVYYGMDYDVSEFNDLVCTEAQSRVDGLRVAVAEAFQLMRCMYTYENAMHQNGASNFRVASEEYLARMENGRYNIGTYCGGPCKCAKAKTVEGEQPHYAAKCADIPKELKQDLKARLGLKMPGETDSPEAVKEAEKEEKDKQH